MKKKKRFIAQFFNKDTYDHIIKNQTKDVSENPDRIQLTLQFIKAVPSHPYPVPPHPHLHPVPPHPFQFHLNPYPVPDPFPFPPHPSQFHLTLFQFHPKMYTLTGSYYGTRTMDPRSVLSIRPSCFTKPVV